jgi:hypothetical protein
MKKFKDHPNYYMEEDTVFRISHTRNGRNYRQLKLKETHRNRDRKNEIKGYYLDSKFYSLKKLKEISS